MPLSNQPKPQSNPLLWAPVELVYSIVWLVVLPCGKTCRLLLLVRCLCLHPTPKNCGRQITLLPGNVSDWGGGIQSLRELRNICMLQRIQLDMYTVTIACYRSERKYMKSWWASSLRLQPEHVQSFLLPELSASAFDPISSERLSSKGHRMRALDLAPPQGRNLHLKERLERETYTPGP